MATETKDEDGGMRNEASAAITSAIEDTRKKLMSALLPSIDNHVTNESFDHQKDGLDFLEVKNGLMLSYLIDLTQLIRVQSSESTNDDNNDKSLTPCLDRLRTMKVALDKMRPMEKKLRYSLDKLLALSATSSAFAVGEAMVPARGGEGTKEAIEQSDPLSYRPNPERLLGEGDDDDGDTSSSDAADNDTDGSGASDDNDRSSVDSNSEDSGDDDDELKAAKTALNIGRSKTTKKRHEMADSSSNDPSSNKEQQQQQIYRAPRLVAVPFAEREKQAQREEHLAKKERNRMLKSELLSTLRSSFGDAPEEEDYGGGATLGKQREAAQRLADRDKERTEFEENTMMRLTTSRKDKKMRNKVMRDEVSNMNAIADLSNLTAGVSAAFGDGSGHNGGRGGLEDTGDNSKRHMNGKRRRTDDFGESLDTRQNDSAQKRKPRSHVKNSFQKALYGGDGGGGGGSDRKKSSKKSQRRS